MPGDGGFSSCPKCGFLEGHAPWCSMRAPQAGPAFAEGYSPRLEDVRIRIHREEPDVATSAGARQVAEELRRARSIELLARELQGQTFTDEEGKTLLGAIASQIRPPLPGVPAGLGTQKAENVERDILQNGREHSRGSVRSIFNYRAPRPDMHFRFQAVREAFIHTAGIILSNVPPCADRMQAIEELRRVMMIANAAIALDGEELQV